MGTLFSSVRVSRSNGPGARKRKRKALSVIWWIFAVFTFVVNIWLVVTSITSFAFVVDGAATGAEFDWPIALGVVLCIPLFLNLAAIFLNAADNEILARLTLGAGILANALTALSVVVLLIVHAVVGVYRGTGRFYTYFVIMCLFLGLAAALTAFVAVAMAIQCFSIRAYAAYGVRRWWRSRHQHRKPSLAEGEDATPAGDEEDIWQVVDEDDNSAERVGAQAPAATPGAYVPLPLIVRRTAV